MAHQLMYVSAPIQEGDNVSLRHDYITRTGHRTRAAPRIPRFFATQGGFHPNLLEGGDHEVESFFPEDLLCVAGTVSVFFFEAYATEVGGDPRLHHFSSTYVNTAPSSKISLENSIGALPYSYLHSTFTAPLGVKPMTSSLSAGCVNG